VQLAVWDDAFQLSYSPVNSYLPTSFSMSSLRRLWRVMLVCSIVIVASVTGVAHAADALRQAVQPASNTQPALPLFTGLKESLFWLRDFTFTAVAPMHRATASSDNRIVLIPSSFDIRHELFKPISQGLYGDRLRHPFKQDGVEVRDNLLFQYELLPAASRTEGRDFHLKLGLHYAFR